MRVFTNKPFQRFARREGIESDSLCAAIERAENGQIDADLGGGVIKQRIARLGTGKSGGYRTIILYRALERAFFVYGFAKSDRANITGEELKAFRQLAGLFLGYSDEQLESAVLAGVLSEVNCGD